MSNACHPRRDAGAGHACNSAAACVTSNASSAIFNAATGAAVRPERTSPSEVSQFHVVGGSAWRSNTVSSQGRAIPAASSAMHCASRSDGHTAGTGRARKCGNTAAIVAPILSRSGSSARGDNTATSPAASRRSRQSATGLQTERMRGLATCALQSSHAKDWLTCRSVGRWCRRRLCSGTRLPASCGTCDGQRERRRCQPPSALSRRQPGSSDWPRI